MIYLSLTTNPKKILDEGEDEHLITISNEGIRCIKAAYPLNISYRTHKNPGGVSIDEVDQIIKALLTFRIEYDKAISKDKG